MRKTKILSLVTVILLVGMAVWSFSFAREAPGKEKDNTVNMLRKPTGEPLFQILNINNLWWWMKNNGESSHSPNDDSGIYYPRGMVWCIYKDGIKWSGRAYMDEAYTQPAYQQRIRIGGNDYGNGTDEGWIEGYAETAEQIPAGDARVRLWRIRRDYYSMAIDEDGNWTDEITRDAKEYNELGATDAISDDEIQEVYDLYDYDWKNWPVDLGAPYVDRNGNGQYDPPPDFSDTFTYEDLIPGGYDEPGVVGGDVNSPADQVIWNVFNDLDETKTLGLEGSYPLGWEIQRTIWGYKRTDAMGNIAFSQTLIINKGGVEIDAAGNTGIFYCDSCWIWQWSDPDLGAFSDDLLGCDTVLNLGYVYNGNAIDREYARYGQVVPAAGYDFLAGPIVESPGDVAVFNLKYRQDYANLGMTAFFWFSAGSPISDPDSDYEGGLEWDAMARGFQPLADRDVPYPVPPGHPDTKFPLSGDPVTQTGLVDGQGEQWSFAPGDRRLGLSSGPWEIGPGDTQQVVIGFVVGQGSDRLSSISVMKFNDRFAQLTYDALFQVPSAPKQPIVGVTELDENIILNWGSNLTRVNDIENTVSQPGAYTFEGYNVYQLPRERSQLNEAKRIATYDLVTDPTVILDEQFDKTSGRVLFLPVQYGSNSGVKRYFEFKRDYIRDIDKIYNGEEYYLAVTAYSRATVEGYIPATLESTPQVYTVIPKVPFGVEYQTAFFDTLDYAHDSGVSDGYIIPMVIDPKLSTGDTYQVEFYDTGADVLSWKATNVTDGNVIIEDQTNQTADDNYDMVEGGILLKVSGPPPGVKDYHWLGDNDRFVTWGGGAGGFEFEGFGGAIGWASPRNLFGDGWIVPADQIKHVEIHFANADEDGNFDPDQDNVSYGYRYGRGFTGAAALPEFAQYMVNTTGGGYSYQDFTKSVPLAAYDMEQDPMRRLAVAHLENNQPGGMVDGKYWPPYYPEADNTASSGPREWLFIMDEDYSETPNPDYQVDIISGPQPVMLYITWARRYDVPWTDQDGFQIIVNKPNTVDDVFSYICPAPESGVDLEKFSAENVGVYPNPYYAFNPAELTRLSRFVTFNNLPPEAKIRIFNLAGHLVRVIEKDNTSQFQRWDLLNNDGLPVASGMYIAHLTMTMPTDGSEVTKVLKLAVIQEQEVLDVY